MEDWVDLVDLIAPRSGVEVATFRSRVRRRTAAPFHSIYFESGNMAHKHSNTENNTDNQKYSSNSAYT